MSIPSTVFNNYRSNVINDFVKVVSPQQLTSVDSIICPNGSIHLYRQLIFFFSGYQVTSVAYQLIFKIPINDFVSIIYIFWRLVSIHIVTFSNTLIFISNNIHSSGNCRSTSVSVFIPSYS